MTRIQDDSLTDALAIIEPRDFLEQEGIEFKETRGSSGPQFNVKTCPVCGASKWKVFVNQESGVGNCFSGSCEARFNKYKFIKAQLGLDDRATVAYVRQLAGSRGWRPVSTKRVAVAVQESPSLPLSYKLPMADGGMLGYLVNRGVTADLAKYYDLRFCLDGWFNYMKDDGSRGGQNYSMRVLIPIYDIEGVMVSFQGRDITGTAEKKYLFPPGFASTGKHLYNIQNVIMSDTVVVGEGVFDVIAIDAALREDPALHKVATVGTFGKHLSQGPDSQLERFKLLANKGLKSVVFMWDGEVQATDDALAAARLIIGLGLAVRVAVLPFAKDPNEVDKQTVREAFYRAKPFTELMALQLMMQRRNEAFRAKTVQSSLTP